MTGIIGRSKNSLDQQFKDYLKQKEDTEKQANKSMYSPKLITTETGSYFHKPHDDNDIMEIRRKMDEFDK